MDKYFKLIIVLWFITSCLLYKTDNTWALPAINIMAILVSVRTLLCIKIFRKEMNEIKGFINGNMGDDVKKTIDDRLSRIERLSLASMVFDLTKWSRKSFYGDKNEK